MHYFMFSQGSYSDYGVGGLYACDHEVSKKEWEAHYKCYQAEVSERNDVIREKYANRPHRELVRDQEYLADRAAQRKWEEENNPEQTFIAKHGMTKVEYTELWRDC